MADFLAPEMCLIEAVDGLALGLPTGYPNKELGDDQKGDGLWLQLHTQFGETNPFTMGTTGEDENRGFYQIDINYPKGKGTGDPLNMATQIGSAFPSGKILAYNGSEVKILRTGLSPGRYIGGYYRLSLTIYYYNMTVRNL